MPSIGKFFANSKVSDWRSGSLGGGGGGLGAFSATGGNSTGTSGSYTWHKFTSSGTFTVTGGEANIEVFVVGGGGGGSSTDYPSYPYGQSDAMSNAGGGGGGYVERTHHVSVNGGASEDGAYAVTIGSGGSGGSIPTYGAYQGNPSKFDVVEAIGGGGGARGSNYNAPADYPLGAPLGWYVAGGCGAAPGGSGIGGTTPTSVRPGKVYNNINTNSSGQGAQGYGAGQTLQGNNYEKVVAGGGGGQGGLGGDGVWGFMPWMGWGNVTGGAGGAGRSNDWMGSPVLYGGGGGSVGAKPSNASTPYGGAAGPGGGASGGNSPTSPAPGHSQGATNTGGGGGGVHSPSPGGSGGSGVVIVRYPT